ncbi:hypothetical protein SCA6_019774 [Theobroma cacao]
MNLPNRGCSDHGLLVDAWAVMQKLLAGGDRQVHYRELTVPHYCWIIGFLFSSPIFRYLTRMSLNNVFLLMVSTVESSRKRALKKLESLRKSVTAACSVERNKTQTPRYLLKTDSGNLLSDDFYFSALNDDEEVFPLSDEKYTFELQLQEVLMSSAISSRVPTGSTDWQMFQHFNSRKSSHKGKEKETVIDFGSQKFYCPFQDCSAMFVDDGGHHVVESECPNCHRLFSAKCKVAWHAGISCSEFQNLSEDERASEDIMIMELDK